jgi:hypothetical protein
MHSNIGRQCGIGTHDLEFDSFASRRIDLHSTEQSFLRTRNFRVEEVGRISWVKLLFFDEEIDQNIYFFDAKYCNPCPVSTLVFKKI